MPLTEIAGYGLVWPVWVALGGFTLMAAVLLLLLVVRRPFVAAWVNRLLLRAASVRGRLLAGFVLLAVIPTVTLPPLLGLNAANRLQREQVAALEGLVQTVADSLPGMVSKRVELINGLATHINSDGDFGDAALAGWLLRHHQDHGEFVSMWIARPDGRVAVATAARNGTAERWGGPIAGVGVMDYFEAAVEQGGRYVSTVRKGVAAGFDPMIFISAPIGKGGQKPWGYLQAQLNLSKVFGHFVMQDARAGSEILMTDSQGRVMLSSPRLAFRRFESLDGHPLRIALDRHPEATSFAFAGKVLLSEQDGRYVAATRALTRGWRVFAVASQAPVQSLVTFPLLIGGLWTLLALLLARGLAAFYSEAVVSPLRKLDESLDIFDADRTMAMIPAAPDDAPDEVREVYRKVRQSMRKSRDAYHNMMRALNEGADLKRKLRDASGGELDNEEGRAFDVVEGVADEFAGQSEKTWCGRIDTVTELPGNELFQEFFDDAWRLGVANGKPLSVILLKVGSANNGTLAAVAGALGSIGGRSLDFLARIEAQEFGVVLPETTLEGALAVADRIRDSARNGLMALGGERMPRVNIGVASIRPNADGNANSFVEVARRVLQSSTKHGDGQIAYIDDQGKIHLASSLDLEFQERAG